MQKKEDIKLYPNDAIYFFSNEDLEFLSSYTMLSAFNPKNEISCDALLDFSNLMREPRFRNDVSLSHIRRYFNSMNPFLPNNLNLTSVPENIDFSEDQLESECDKIPVLLDITFIY